MNRYLGNYGDVEPFHRAVYVARDEDGGIVLAEVEPARDPEGYLPEDEPEHGWSVTVLPLDVDELDEDPERDPGGWAPWDFSDLNGVLSRRDWDPDTLEEKDREDWPEGYADLRDALLAEALLTFHGAYYLNAAEYERDTRREALEKAASEIGVPVAKLEGNR